MVFDAAMHRSPKLLREQLQRVFTVDRGALPERYRTWLTLPWHRIYTLNIDDIDAAVSEAPGARLQILSALSSTPGVVREDATAVVHLNGTLVEFPEVTFTPADFASRTVSIDPWYEEFVADLISRPVVVVGSVLDESPLWHYLEQRGGRGGGKELRPRSWLVSPHLDVARRAMLRGLNIEHLAMSEEEFFNTVLASAAPRLIAAREATRSANKDNALLDVARSIQKASAGDAGFLLGATPTWGDVTNGYAATFEFDQTLSDEIEGLSSGTISVIGSAGSGKTTSLMRAASVLSAAGNSVLWLDRETEIRSSDLIREVQAREPDYLFIDDLDRFSDHARQLLTGLHGASDALVVVTGTRSGRYVNLGYDRRLSLDVTLEQSRLTDGDAEALLDELGRGRRLGALVTLNRREQINQITKRADRQLLVTLIEATSGRRFTEKIAEECRSLSGVEQALYGVACTALWADNKPLSKRDLLFAAQRSAEPNATLAALTRLTDAHLLRVENGRLRPRHRVVAESAVDFFRAERLLGSWITDLIFLTASHYDLHNMKRSRYGRLLIRLISHNQLRTQLGDVETVRRVYGAAEAWLEKDPHFWLQRGSFETDHGDLPAADNYLRQAYALAPDDWFVDTAWAMLQLKKAVQEPMRADAHVLAEEALELLIPIMKNSDLESPHTFAVYQIWGLKWLRSANLGTQEEASLRDDLLYYGKIGSARFRQAADVQDSWNASRRWITTNPMVQLNE